MNEQDIIKQLNSNTLPFIKMLGGVVADVDLENSSCTFEFTISTDFCHSIDVVQGGFVTAMMDAAMSHAVFGLDKSIENVSSLEIKTNYLEPTRAGKLRAVGSILKSGYKVAFLEAQLFNEEGLLTATASSVAKLVRAKA
ncbi:MAG: PaaI family thioesterase [Halioglobus sp.]